jgi:D-glycero-D-manno-heptose 1,7-bisphosphate phosphatase
MPLLILDRDGVINQDSDDYIRCVDDWVPIPGSIKAIADLSRAGYHIAVATNQSGLSRGYFTLDDLEEIHALLCRQVEEYGGTIAGIFYCPHLPEEGCSCRKPATGLLRAIEQEIQLSAQGAFFIGDSMKDLQAASAYGCKPVLVETGKGVGTLASLQSGEATLHYPHEVPVYRDLAEATKAILNA